MTEHTQNNEAQSSYRSIFKATSLFGGVQIWKILISIVKQKFIAILLGPTGMGISGLYTSATSFVQSFTAMGLSTSAVKNVAEAAATGDKQRINRVIATLRKLVWITGLLGTVAVMVLSPVLSKSSFGNYDYTIPFIILSVTLLFQQLSSGQSVVLQGLRRLKHLALAGVFGSLFGLVFSIPIYYFFGVKGIVPTLILDSVTTLLLTWYFARKIPVDCPKMTLKETVAEGKNMLGMGLSMSLTNILTLGIAYLLRAFIAHTGGTEQVGLYTAGFAIVNTYIGMVFTAMSTDYYPRLSSVNTDNAKCRDLINQQAEIATLLVAPLALVFIVLAPFIIIILYSEAFLDVVPFMQLCMLGMLFKAGSWSISFVFLAKSDMKQFIFNEILIKVINVPMYLLSYKYFGLVGMGAAYLLNYFIYMLLVFIVANRRYGFYFSKDYKNQLIIFGVLLLLSFVSLVLIDNNVLSYAISTLCILVGLLFAYQKLDAKLNINDIVKRVFSNKTHN